ncbi:MAG: heme ABC exporter ATP-binding protein CcmA [Methyloligellaceae bacterium]
MRESRWNKILVEEAENPALELAVESLDCIRGDRMLFRDLSFSLTGGRSLLLQGANGSGKTSLLRILAGYLPAESGRVKLKIGGIDHEREMATHYVGHKDGIKAQFTVRENLLFWGQFFGSGIGSGSNNDETPQLDDFLMRFNLWDLREIPSNLLSAGQKRRLCLARLLIARRDLWLLDEPSHALDRDSQALLADVMKSHLDSGGMVIATTHIPLGLDFDNNLVLGEEYLPT